MKNYQRGAQRTVTRNVVKFAVGDFVGSRLRGENLRGVVLEVTGMDYIRLAEGTFDSDYFYIIKGVDETDVEQFRRHLDYEELTRNEVSA